MVYLSLQGLKSVLHSHGLFFGLLCLFDLPSRIVLRECFLSSHTEKVCQVLGAKPEHKHKHFGGISLRLGSELDGASNGISLSIHLLMSLFWQRSYLMCHVLVERERGLRPSRFRSYFKSQEPCKAVGHRL